MPSYVPGTRLRTGKKKGEIYNTDVGWHLEPEGRLADELYSERNGTGNWKVAENLGSILCLAT